jgi:uncharacterized protein (TIGR03083 family)
MWHRSFSYTSTVNEIGGLYAEGRARLSGMVLDLGPEQLAKSVPACPEWTVRDVIAHLAGACSDVVAGNLDGVTTAPWADAQVRRRQGHTIAQLLEEWSAAGPILEQTVESYPPPLPTLWIVDLTAHEHDVRGALAQPGARATHGLFMAVDFLVREGLHRQLVARELGSLAVRTPGACWTVGGTAPPAASGESGAAAATVETSLFEAFRALTGRRSPEQIARYSWTTDPEPFLPAFQFGTFTTRTTDLHE